MALTQKYVTRTAAGGGTGFSLASPLTVSEMVTAINGNTEAGNIFNVQDDGTQYTRTATDTISGGGTATSPVGIRGFKLFIGDGYQGRTNGNGPLITTHMPLINYSSTFRLNFTGNFIIIESLNVAASVSGGVIATTGTDCVIRACKAVNASTGASTGLSTSTTGARTTIIDCDAYLTGGSGGTAAIVAQAAGVLLIGCRITGGSAPGVLTRSTVGTSGCTIFNSSIGISVDLASASCVISGNTITGCAGDGIDVITNTTGAIRIINNQITDNGGYGIDLNGTSFAVLSNNRTRDNTSGAINGGTDWAAATSYGHVTTDTGGAATDYTNAGSNDYSLIAASPAVGAAIPAYASIGALQRSSQAGGMLFNPNLAGT